MTLIIEADRGFNAKPGLFRSRIMTRVWWLWFAVALLHIPLDEYADRAKYQWKHP